jgi:hypothetical protein
MKLPLTPERQWPWTVKSNGVLFKGSNPKPLWRGRSGLYESFVIEFYKWKVDP